MNAAGSGAAVAPIGATAQDQVAWSDRAAIADRAVRVTSELRCAEQPMSGAPEVLRQAPTA
jgi:hypothetical protein